MDCCNVLKYLHVLVQKNAFQLGASCSGEGGGAVTHTHPITYTPCHTHLPNCMLGYTTRCPNACRDTHPLPKCMLGYTPTQWKHYFPATSFAGGNKAPLVLYGFVMVLMQWNKRIRSVIDNQGAKFVRNGHLITYKCSDKSNILSL